MRLLSARTRQKQWVIHPPDDRCELLAKSLRISHLLAQVLLNRSINDTRAGNLFLRPKLNELIGPQLMPGIEAAVHRLKQAIENKEKITLYGDYDVDGITGVSILLQVLNLLGANVDYYIPHRIDEGYGLNTEAIQLLAKQGSKIIVTIDCGIGAIDSAELAEQLGIELIITDHHQPEGRLPKAVAIVHPALDESYFNQDSSGSMVAYKLAWAIANQFCTGPRLEPHLREFMLNATGLAALGTVADVMDMRGENRVLTSFGLKALPESKLPGIQALIETAGLTGQGLNSYDIGFKLAPMLNAAGRMGHARLAVELLTSNSMNRSIQIAEYLKEQNSQRQRCERKIFEQACEIIIENSLNHPDQKSIVLAGENWHAGVLGIVASRIVETFYRPTIMINIPDKSEPACGEHSRTAQGSGRSIPGFCLLSAIRACGHHLISFGGHKMAAGINIEPEKIDRFTEDFEVYAKQNLNDDDTVAKLHIDALAALSEFNRDVVGQFGMLGPFGPGNPPPVFATEGVRLAGPPRRVGIRNDHLQLVITDNRNSIRCIGFGMGKLEKKLLERDFFNVAYQAQINNYNSASSVEFVLADIQFE
ncbi:MAG: single-stranded-DNA-specific exonuclease RecJ [Planctomycetes bacterium RBG_13_44_8b]|nr:MAG: single-stranded-DNA-specific exonuclease RecJ [Planctomycetes bacterium RBG_13_44_8b]